MLKTPLNIICTLEHSRNTESDPRTAKHLLYSLLGCQHLSHHLSLLIGGYISSSGLVALAERIAYQFSILMSDSVCSGHLQ